MVCATVMVLVSVPTFNPCLMKPKTVLRINILLLIKDFIHHYPRALFNDIARVGA